MAATIRLKSDRFKRFRRGLFRGDTMNGMLNVANLEPRWFEEILAGRKRVEYRLRRRVDPRLEAIRPGERLALLECGSDRVIHTTIERVSRRPA